MVELDASEAVTRRKRCASRRGVWDGGFGQQLGGRRGLALMQS